VTALPDEDEDEVAADISKYDLLALPVVDEHDRLLGIVTFDDALDVVEDDSEESEGRLRFFKIFGIAFASLIGLIVYTLVLFQIIGYRAMF
ncbi:CBS domain-containing protein, partial [Gordonibacter pamelaeae]|uniref:CBS domain-containing protein n=1 Tax=Gordonibacter pamelaeae TaxID=471189 RepID=UPI0039F61E64